MDLSHIQCTFVTIRQCDSEQRPFKVSFHVRKEESTHIMPMLVQKLEAKGVSINMRINILASLHALPPSPPRSACIGNYAFLKGFDKFLLIKCTLDPAGTFED